MEDRIKILVVRQESNMVGDTVCLIPFFRALKIKFPDSYIALVHGWSHYPVSYKKIIPELDEVIYYDNSSLKSKINFYRKLRKNKFDIGIVPSTIRMSGNSHIINFLSGAKKRLGVRSIDGEKNKFHFLLNTKSDFEWETKRIHQVERGLDVIRQIGCNLSREEINKIRYEFSEADLFFAENYINEYFPDKNKMIIGFHPGAGQEKNIWHHKNFAELIELIYNRYKPYILISSGVIDKDITNKLSDILKQKEIPYTIFDKKEGEFVCVLSKLSLFISNDTGGMHLAGISGVKVLSFFRPSYFNQWTPMNDENINIVSETEDINSIKVKDVFEKVISLIGK